ncbi:PspC domain-containing protein [Agaribacter flavus]|uniref:PspC domain-containing protein n=1 Tax=Agaribacter flavus TaxID=1902781 RepID=A0ABV7FNB8_9ALTE
MNKVINNNKFYRDPHNAKVAGVCAGLAKEIQVNPWWVRAGAVATFLFVPFAVGLAYVLAILLLRYRY